MNRTVVVVKDTINPTITFIYSLRLFSVTVAFPRRE